jgi:hypothetical protein
MGKKITYCGITLESVGTHSYRVSVNKEIYHEGMLEKAIVLSSKVKTSKGIPTIHLGQVRIVVKETPHVRIMEIYEEFKFIVSHEIDPHDPITA